MLKAQARTSSRAHKDQSVLQAQHTMATDVLDPRSDATQKHTSILLPDLYRQPSFGKRGQT